MGLVSWSNASCLGAIYAALKSQSSPLFRLLPDRRAHRGALSVLPARDVSVREGDVASSDIRSPRGKTFESEVLTDQAREAAALAVPPVMLYDPGVKTTQVQALDQVTAPSLPSAAPPASPRPRSAPSSSASATSAASPARASIRSSPSPTSAGGRSSPRAAASSTPRSTPPSATTASTPPGATFSPG